MSRNSLSMLVIQLQKKYLVLEVGFEVDYLMFDLHDLELVMLLLTVLAFGLVAVYLVVAFELQEKKMNIDMQGLFLISIVH